MRHKLHQAQLDSHVRANLKPAIKRWLTGFGEEWEFSKCTMADRIYDDLNTGSNSGDFWTAWSVDQPMSVVGILKVLEGPEVDMIDIANDTEDDLLDEKEVIA